MPAAPALPGADTAELLRTIGRSEQEIARLMADGVVTLPPQA